MCCSPHRFADRAATHYHTRAWQTLIHGKECFILLLIFAFRNPRMRLFIQLFGVILAISLVLSIEETGYHECTYNAYRATCLNNTNPLYHSNMRLAQFPNIKGRTCVMLHNNIISRFPVDLTHTETVVTLNLQNNLIEELPMDLTPMEHLEILDLSRNRMVTLSPRTRFPVSLRGLLLAGNNMKTIPAGIEIPGLYVFDLSNNLFESVPEHFCVSDQLFRVDLTGNNLKHDLSLSLPILNRCRNIRKIPYCLFTNDEQLSCDCPTLAKIVGQTQRFCLGTPFRGREIKCKPATSSAQYKNKFIFDVNVTRIKHKCSHALLQADAHDEDDGDSSAGHMTEHFMYVLGTIVLSRPFLV